MLTDSPVNYKFDDENIWKHWKSNFNCICSLQI